ncbi:hypothetical protein ABK040_011660 [Willaertia magna]
MINDRSEQDERDDWINNNNNNNENYFEGLNLPSKEQLEEQENFVRKLEGEIAELEIEYEDYLTEDDDEEELLDEDDNEEEARSLLNNQTSSSNNMKEQQIELGLIGKEMNWQLFEHPEIMEGKNLIYFYNCCKLLKEKKIEEISLFSFLNNYYHFNQDINEDENVGLYNFFIFQMIFQLTEILLFYYNKGWIKNMSNKKGNIERYDANLFLENINFKVNSLENIIKSQFINISLNDEFYLNLFGLTKKEIDLDYLPKTYPNQEELVFNLGIFILQLLLLKEEKQFLSKILHENNEISICKLVIENNRSHSYLIRFLTSVLRYDNYKRINLINLMDIEVVHVLSCISEDRKEFFEKLTLSEMKKKSNLKNESNDDMESNNLVDYLKNHFLIGIAYYGSKKHEECVNYLKQCVLLKQEFEEYICKDLLFTKDDIIKFKENPPYFIHIAYSFMGKALAELKEYDEAMVHSETSLKVLSSESNTTALFTKAYILDKIEKYEESEKLYEHVLLLYPTYSMAHNNRGICLKRLGNHKLAIEEYRNSLQLDPSNHLTYNNRALYYNDKHQNEKAILYYALSIKLKPFYHMPISNLGYTYCQMSKFDKAIDMFTKSLKFNNTNINAYANRGYCYMRKLNYQLAAADYMKCVKDLKNEERNILYNLSLCMFNLKRYKEAIYYITKVIHKNPRDEWALYNRSLFYEKEHEYHLALEDIDMFLALSPNHISGLALQTRYKVMVNRVTRIS